MTLVKMVLGRWWGRLIPLATALLAVGCSGTTDPFATSLTQTTLASTTETVTTATTMSNTQEPSSQLVDMYEWDPEGGFHDVVLSGTLTIEAGCAYIDVIGEEDLPGSYQDKLWRSFLYLSELRTEFDSATGALWVNGNGPMYSGDRVRLIGSEGRQGDRNLNHDDGTEGMGLCPVPTSFFVASMAPADTTDANTPRISELPGLGLYPWDPRRLYELPGPEGGTIVIEPPCVYLLLETWSPTEEWDSYPLRRERYFLNMPRPRVRYDPITETLWNGIDGPFASGDDVQVIFGAPKIGVPSEGFIASGCTATGNGTHLEYRTPYLTQRDWPPRVPDDRRERLPAILPILASIREIEGARVAGWGIYPAGDLIGWISLAGDAQPSAEAVRIARVHPDVEIRVGAAHTYAELLAARHGLFKNIEATGFMTDLERMVTYTGIDMKANAIRIGIDPALANPCDITETGRPTMSGEVFQIEADKIAEQLQDVLDVAFVIVDGRGFGTDSMESDCPDSSN